MEQTAQRTLAIAQREAPQFKFCSDSVEAWPHAKCPDRILVTLADRYDDEIEVTIDKGATDEQISEQVWREIDGRSEAAAACDAAKNAERSALACDR